MVSPIECRLQSQPDALGPVGNFFMAVLLVVLCAGSFWSTVGRQFQVRGRAVGADHRCLVGRAAAAHLPRILAPLLTHPAHAPRVGAPWGAEG